MIASGGGAPQRSLLGVPAAGQTVKTVQSVRRYGLFCRVACLSVAADAPQMPAAAPSSIKDVVVVATDRKAAAEKTEPPSNLSSREESLFFSLSWVLIFANRQNAVARRTRRKDRAVDRTGKSGRWIGPCLAALPAPASRPLQRLVPIGIRAEVSDQKVDKNPHLGR